jgi:uncharacterized protein (DUF885 family)
MSYLKFSNPAMGKPMGQVCITEMQYEPGIHLQTHSHRASFFSFVLEGATSNSLGITLTDAASERSFFIQLERHTGILFINRRAVGPGGAPFKTPAGYENNLKRNHQYVQLIDKIIGRFREGMASGVVQPKLTVQRMIDQLDAQLAQGVEGSTFYGPVKHFPEGIAAADQERLRGVYVAMVRDEIHPALLRLRNFLKDEYLPAAREGVGLYYMEGGPRLYKFLIEQNTNLPLTADTIHNLGLSEVARIHREHTNASTILSGGSRIRTHGELAPPAVFKTAALNHSAIPPKNSTQRTRRTQRLI